MQVLPTKVIFVFILDSMDEKFDYNSLPVYYCTHCPSLTTKCDASIDSCANCSSTDIESCSIDKYDEIYRKRFGVNYFNK